MNIGFYGHSICSYIGQEFSFIKKIEDHYNADIVHTGCAICSEERILFEIKKTKKLDLAVIFHSAPTYLFVPGWDRDIKTVEKNFLIKKINSMLGKKIFGKEWRETITLDADRKSDPEALLLWYQEQLNKTKLKEDEFKYNELIEALLLNKKYLFHPDLQISRYYGALMQLDQYLAYKQIPVVHCLNQEKFYPKWFKFTTGITDKGVIQPLQKDSKYAVLYSQSANALNEQGNQIAFDHLTDLINRLPAAGVPSVPSRGAIA